MGASGDALGIGIGLEPNGANRVACGYNGNDDEVVGGFCSTAAACR